MKLLLATILLALATQVSAFQPRTGLWFNPAEPGTGYNIDVQNGTIVVTIFSFDAAGGPQWYLAAGPMANGQRSFSGTLGKYTGGQCVACPYQPAQIAGSDGSITLNFTNETAGTISLAGRTTSIQAFDFGYGSAPASLLGEWIFVWDILNIAFVERYNFTTIGPATQSGNGIVADLSRYAACELQASGSYAGRVFCADFTSSLFTTASDVFVFRYGIDETFDGQWISPTSGRSYPMKGFRVANPAGSAKAVAGADAAAIAQLFEAFKVISTR